MRRGLWAEPGDQRERIEDHLLALEQSLEDAESNAVNLQSQPLYKSFP
jgi:hypothetical protein